MSDWGEMVRAAFGAALAIFAFIFLKTADLSSVQSGGESLQLFLIALVLSLKPTGFSLIVDAGAATLSGVVSFRMVGENVVATIFVFLLLYFFISLVVNYLFVAPGMV
ncbi:hypothetical protein [Candidatus Halobonum tyrrellensis]|nr:hypothetical protein [Candidatus Halobonum tyrrellensis]